MAELTQAELQEADARRCEWRADLLEYSAAVLDTVGMDGDAAEKRKVAARFRSDADAQRAYTKARATGDPAIIEAAKVVLREHRTAARNSGVTVVGVVNGFDEPSRVELMEGAA